MRVMGFTDEITVCDCCGKRNLSGTFTVEDDAGELMSYGSVCVNKVYGKRRGDEIKAVAKKIARIQAGTWTGMLDRYSRGYFGNNVIACYEDASHPRGFRFASTNSTAELARATHIRLWPSQDIVRARGAE